MPTKKRSTRKKQPARSLKTVCPACGRCCIEPVVPVTGSDIRRIAAHTGMPPRRFLRLYSTTEADYDTDAGLWIRFPYGKRMLGLRKRGGKCMFLSPENLCSIYDSRPVTCRTFPFQYEDRDDGKGEKLTINKAVPCRLRPADSKLQPDIKALHTKEDREDRKWEAKIRRFNRKQPGGGKEAFFEFVGLD